MGTRHLICVQHDNDIKVAQYGQWDGYPDGQGANIVNFLTNQFIRKKFIEELNKVRWITEKEIEEVNKDTNWKENYPYLSRDAGSDVLVHIQNGTVKFLQDSRDFANDSLFCEYGYVINLDNNTLEVYKGFNQSPIAEDERFYTGKANDGGYYPIRLWMVVPFAELDTFVEKAVAKEKEEGDE